MSRFLLPALLALTLAGTCTTSATACDYIVKKVVCYQTYTTYETRYETFTRCVTCYDECGRPYIVEVLCKRAITVPVKKVRAVVKYAKVCY